ncbi:MAG: ATP-binding cassette domain-containing protein [Bulleidia sp.]
MLQIRDICKEYRTGDLVQKALNHVSLNLRDNEFVAILGPSGSGKTTLLNIIGGLDRYDSGDLIINGISTKKYRDADWDSYRNHTIGFVFQSYNLIPHQTVLSNVELALTISGISKSERKQRAVEALKAVGLGEQIHKKPNQMSGGQMQRVALARALVNDPDILLADEPTGALDSETSIQVMDLLKEVARDRLVVMVTHNPELAKQYATRIVSLKDGKITDDTNPFEVKATDQPIRHENMGKASMSFLTALSLSFNNLLTKKTRTLLVSFAGSIGIIGIALILSLSTGVNAYVHQIEEDALSEYPLQITSNTMNMSNLMQEGGPHGDSTGNGEVKEVSVVSGMVNTMSENDLGSLKAYFDSGKSGIEDFTRTVEYTYDVTPQLFIENNGSIHQVNPNALLTSSGLMPSASIYSMMMQTTAYTALPAKRSLYENAYDVKAGRWPQSYNEAVVVLSDRGTVSDMTLYSLGMKDYSEFETMVQNMSSGSAETMESETGTWNYSDFLDADVRLINASDCYKKDENLNVFTDMREDDAYMQEVYDNSEPLKIVGVVQSNDPEKTGVLTTGICYSPDLIEHVVKTAETSDLVRTQMASKDINVLTGEPFGKTETDSFSMQDLFTVDTSAFNSAFSFDPSKISLNLSRSDLAGAMNNMNVQLSDQDIQKILDGVEFKTDNIDLTVIIQDLVDSFTDQNTLLIQESQAFLKYMTEGSGTQILKDTLNEILQEKLSRGDLQNLMNDISSQLAQAFDPSRYENAEDMMAAYEQFLQSQQAQDIITSALETVDITLTDEDIRKVVDALTAGYGHTVDTEEIRKQFNEWMEGDAAETIILNDVMEMLDVNGAMNRVMDNAMNVLGTQMADQMSSVMNQLSASIGNSLAASMQNAFRFNGDALQNAFRMNMDVEELKRAFSSMMTNTSTTYEGNLSSFGYADLSDPTSIVIYPNDFESKQEVKNIISAYNTDMENRGEDDKVILYVDTVATLMSSVTDIVNTITYVLIAFVAISLVVSSIMIGIITYISVYERQKEIGILRAIGASKRNVSNVFNAETFITGLLAGVIGIGITLILLVPGNWLIHTVAGNTEVNAILPVQAAFILIALSVVLTMIGGILPSRKAAKSDPVKALRTE